MRIIGYTYEADVHCPFCTRQRFAQEGDLDAALDREGNPIHPVYDIDENDFTHCGTCGDELT